jgi:NAD(P)-dependent dehydrogenase (short-subunit alcohol dehydrogenase family)
VNSSKPLQDKVAVVAGATRGAGRGIACMLGEAGATVYCTGRSTRGRLAGDRPETIDETAEMVDSFGGHGIAVRVDHTVEAEVNALFERVKAESGGLDILVNDIWGGEALTQFGTPFWQLSMEQGFTMLRQALHSHILTSRYGVPLLLARGSGLVVEITDGNSFTYRGNLFYDLVKTSAIRLAFAMARELRRKNIAAVALTPGYLRSEAMLESFGVTRENWQDAAKKDPDFAESETPFYVGRAVAALASDPQVFAKSGRVFSSWDLAVEYGFSDIDGRRPHWGNHFQKRYGLTYPTCDEGFYKSWAGGPMDTLFANWP